MAKMDARESVCGFDNYQSHFGCVHTYDYDYSTIFLRVIISQCNQLQIVARTPQLYIQELLRCTSTQKIDTYFYKLDLDDGYIK